MKPRFLRLVFALLILISALAVNVSASSCEEQVYQDCLTFCSGVAQEGRCDFYASQACLCWRAPADCPVCY